MFHHIAKKQLRKDENEENSEEVALEITKKMRIKKAKIDRMVIRSNEKMNMWINNKLGQIVNPNAKKTLKEAKEISDSKLI